MHSDFHSIQNHIRREKSAVWHDINARMIRMYWDIGQYLISQDWIGEPDATLRLLSASLRRARLGWQGFSRENLAYMRMLAAQYPDRERAARLFARMPWAEVRLVLEGRDIRAPGQVRG